jgi:hypothetical protein
MKIITTSYNEQYWSLAKILIFNFTFAHILAVFLSAMTSVSPNSNWMTVKGISGSAWS